MSLPNPEPGLVICYSYLWHAEHERGGEEGMKDRPCAIVLTVQDDEGDTIVTVVPVTHTPPQRPDEAIEIPFSTKQRLGLDAGNCQRGESLRLAGPRPSSDLKGATRPL